MDIYPFEAETNANPGVHAGHCCEHHGCAYGDMDCPVVSKNVDMLYSCDSCARDKAMFEVLLARFGTPEMIELYR